ncbi:MAG: hypothetical protein OEV64_04915 [Desulfobulbaceae bacterium]|nr:hypothetical protein [Desulfobulbaceae bacterium]
METALTNETLILFTEYLTQLISFFTGIATGLAFVIASQMRWTK